MSVGVRRRQLKSSLVGLDRFLNASRLIEHIAQIEMSERIARVCFNRSTIVLLGQPVFLPVVIQRAEIDMSCRMARLALKYLEVDGNRFRVSSLVLLERNAAREQFRHIGFFRGGP